MDCCVCFEKKKSHLEVNKPMVIDSLIALAGLPRLQRLGDVAREHASE